MHFGWIVFAAGFLLGSVLGILMIVLRPAARQSDERQLLADLLVCALYCRDELRYEMLQNDRHRAMHEEMVKITQDAEDYLRG